MSRSLTRYYIDPIDAVWLTTAHRIGLKVTRAKEVYAATDGAGMLYIGEPSTLDPDDSLAQMIFHELCHGLVEGPEGRHQPDWGLDNLSDRDTVREHACLRLQAFLAAPWDLRPALAPTTDFRGFYDSLPEDPLTPVDDASVRAAIEATRRVEQEPWAPHLHRALEATAVIFRVAREFGAEDPAAGRAGEGEAIWGSG